LYYNNKQELKNMAHYAELDKNNVVIRVLTACNQDIATHGGELSEEAANYFGTYTPFSENGVKWVQTSYNNNFRKQYAGLGHTFDTTKNKFIAPQPHISWSLDANDDWKAPVTYPTVTTYGDNVRYFISWDESNLRWLGKDGQQNTFAWSPDTSSWIATGN
jgi:hypothetical protein